MSLQEKLLELRKKNGLTQSDLAERLNVSRQAISRWEVGAAVPSTDNLKILSELYGVSADYLLGNGKDIIDNNGYEEKNQDLTSKELDVISENKRSKKYITYIVVLAFLIIVLIISVLPQERQEQITPMKDLDIVVEDDYASETFDFK